MIRFGLLIVKFMFQSSFEEKNDKVSTFNVVHFPNFEISASLELAPHLTLKKFHKRCGRLWYELCWRYGMSSVVSFSWNFPKNFRTAMSKSNLIFMQRVLSKKQIDYSRLNKKRFKFFFRFGLLILKKIQNYIIVIFHLMSD